MIIEKGEIRDIDELEVLYDCLNDYLASQVNYPGWIKGIYPVRETAINAIEEGALFVLRRNSKIAGSIVLNHTPEPAYDQVTWNVDTAYSNIFVVRTLVVHPHFMKQGIGGRLMTFAESYARQHSIKILRLDVSEHNMPAIALYRKLGYKYVGTVDLGLDYPHLKWFELYEKVL